MLHDFYTIRTQYQHKYHHNYMNSIIFKSKLNMLTKILYLKRSNNLPHTGVKDTWNVKRLTL